MFGVGNSRKSAWPKIIIYSANLSANVLVFTNFNDAFLHVGKCSQYLPGELNHELPGQNLLGFEI